MKANINLEFLDGNAGRILGDNRNNAAVNLCKDEGLWLWRARKEKGRQLNATMLWPGLH